MHIWAPSTAELKTSHPNLFQNIALNNCNGKTRAAEQSTNEQKKIPESESSVCCCEFSAFLDHGVWAFSRAAWKHTHNSVHTHRRGRTHAEQTHTKQPSVTQLSLLRYSAAQSNFKNLLVSPPPQGTEFKTTLEHMSYWSDLSKLCSRHTNTSYLSQRGGRWSSNDDWVILAFCHVCSSQTNIKIVFYIRFSHWTSFYHSGNIG